MAKRSGAPDGQQGGGLLAALSPSVSRRRAGMPCGAHLVLTALPENERARVAEIIETIREDRRELGQSRHSAIWLADTLTSHGYEVGRIAVQNHIAFRCKCGY